MSEMINNSKYRQKVLKELVMELHDGKDVDHVKERFAKLIEGVTASEISDMEQNLIAEGMPVEEVQRLCDVHASVFKGSIDEIHVPQELFDTPGHPLHTFTLENQEIERFIDHTVMPHLESYKQEDGPQEKEDLIKDFKALKDLDKHYSRKENLLFPYLEKQGITAPPKVMWGVDDEIREEIKQINNMLKRHDSKDLIYEKAQDALSKIKEMVFKEKNILFPMAIDYLTESEWVEIEKESDEIGYCFISPVEKWTPKHTVIEEKEDIQIGSLGNIDGYVKFETGILSFDEINAIFNHLPFDITFIDKDDMVKYFSLGQDRIFVRTKSVIGRDVANCHPPASVNIVEDIVNDFKSGSKDHEHFWISMGEKYVYIQYFAVRDDQGKYMGVMEVTQDIKPIQEIRGEKRLVSEE